MWRRPLYRLLWVVLAAAGASCGSSYGETAAEVSQLDAGDGGEAHDAGEPSRDAGTETEEASLPGDECAEDMTVDQENLLYQERVLLTPATSLGQSFVVSRDGALARIDVLIQACDYLPLRDDQLRLDVFDGVERIASALTPFAQPATKCQLITDELLPFDFSDACVPLKAQRLYSYTLSAVTTETALFEAEIGVNHQNTYASGTAKVGGTARAMDDHVFRVLIR